MTRCSKSRDQRSDPIRDSVRALRIATDTIDEDQDPDELELQTLVQARRAVASSAPGDIASKEGLDVAYQDDDA